MRFMPRPPQSKPLPGSLRCTRLKARSGKPGQLRREVRQSRARPLIEELHKWMEKALKQLSPKSETAGAIRYSLSRWRVLTRYIDDGRLEIDNNSAERALRVVALGFDYANLRITKRTTCSRAPTPAANGLPPSTRSSARPNSMDSIRRSTFAGCYPRLPTTQSTASATCCPGIWLQVSRPLLPRPPDPHLSQVST